MIWPTLAQASAFKVDGGPECGQYQHKRILAAVEQECTVGGEKNRW